MKLDWQFSLYDFFGFLFPGAILFAALAITYWGIFMPEAHLVCMHLPVECWTLILVLSYLCGHLAQSVTNHLAPWNRDLRLTPGVTQPWWNHDCPAIPDIIEKRVKDEVESILSSPRLEGLEPTGVANFCEHYLLQMGKTGDRDIYQYRRGFYRGISFSYFVLLIALVYRMFTLPMIITFHGGEHTISSWELVFAGVLCLLGALSSLARQFRFQMYLRQTYLYGVLASSRNRSPSHT
jgi:hypothetical protein